MKVTKHVGCEDCDACVKMQEMYATCVYVAETDKCTCDLIRYRKNLGNRKRNVQSVLNTSSTDRVRLRYWRRWLDDQ